MSFGYSTGDVLALIQLVDKVYKRFTDAPRQFETIKKELVKAMPK
jgi:hypothetical protein